MAVNAQAVETSISNNIARAQEYIDLAAEKTGKGQRVFLQFAKQRLDDAINLTRVRDSLEE